MSEQIINVSSKDGPIECFYVTPESNRVTPEANRVTTEADGQWPAIIFYMDAPAIREELYNMARRIARQGYVCILPDLYHRYGRLRFNVHRRTDAMTTVILSAYHGLTDDGINDDTAAMLAFLAGRHEVRDGKVGSIGFCMSGRFITTAAMRFRDQFACAASLYGTRLVTDDEDSPHKRLDGIKAELYYGFGSADTYTPPEYISTFQAALDKTDIRYEMDVFDGVDHGYCFVERAPYDPVASETSWRKVFALFQRNLG